ncbi:unannotated protein [freshwater metagenome]|uniref:Unannotated protein n=1 Tax=freshwater metagenome TaxID=449393 RepID=A0A6J7JG15_9ZZZZ
MQLRRLVVVPLALTLAAALGAGSAAAQSPVALRLEALDGPPGHVRLKVVGPPGAVVTISRDGTARVTVTVGASGTAVADRVDEWRCDRRDLTYAASASAPAATPRIAAELTVRTPSCAQRISVRAPKRLRRGAVASFQVIDRWGLGGARLRVCTLPPGTARSCADRVALADRRPLTVRVRVRRQGRWTVTAGLRGYGPAEGAAVLRPSGGRVRLLTVGDSQVQILDTFISESLRSSGVPNRLTSDARISTGLSNSFFFDWLPRAQQLGAQAKPDVSVVFLGANDGFNLPWNGRTAACCGLSWVKAYAARAGRMMDSFTRGGRGVVYWFLEPVPRDAQFARYFRAVNAGLRRAAAARPGLVRLIDLGAVVAPGGAYRDQITFEGRVVTVRQSDGVHLTPAGDRVAVTLLLRQMTKDGVAVPRR